MNQLAEILVPGLVGAGGGTLLTAGVSTWTARKKVPAEVDSIVVAGAETTVTAALAVAAAEAARADRAEAREAELEIRLEGALARVDALQQALNAIRDELNQMKEVQHR